MKKIQYSVRPMKNRETGETAYYSALQLTGVVSLKEFADHITSHNSVYSKGTIVGVQTEMADCLRELLLQGYKIDLGGIGTFEPSIGSEGTETRNEFSATQIVRMGVNFAPGDDLQNLRRDAEFEKTSTRKVQAAALKAQNEGKTNANWAEEEENEGE